MRNVGGGVLRLALFTPTSPHLPTSLHLTVSSACTEYLLSVSGQSNR